jgi:diguanylate cyclase (GGDEF)-like protein
MNASIIAPPLGDAVAADIATASENALPTFKTPERAPVRGAIGNACLVSIYPVGPLMGTRYPLESSEVLIGRGSDCEICNDDASVSRNHALLTRDEDGHYRVADLGSTNGTFVNNSAEQGGVLRDGDYLRVGNCLYRFLAGGNVEAEYHEEIYRLTIRDSLTQVHNRRYLNEFLEREVARAVRHNRPLAVILFDIDRFKSVNDGMGHLAGDLALRELCSRVRPAIGPDELLARYGGEEFAIVLPEATSEIARATAERVRQIVASRPFEFDGRRYALTVSAGVAVTTGGTHSTVADLLRSADSNLYMAKLNGRNRVVFS